MVGLWEEASSLDYFALNALVAVQPSVPSGPSAWRARLSTPAGRATPAGLPRAPHRTQPLRGAHLVAPEAGEVASSGTRPSRSV